MKSLRPLSLLLLVLAAVTAGGLRWRFQNDLLERDPLQCAAYLDTAAYLESAERVRSEGPIAALGGFRPPGYTWLVAATVPPSGDPRPLLRWQAVLDGVGVLLVGLLAAAWSERSLAGPLAGALYALSPTAIAFSTELLEVTPTAFCVLLHLAALTYATRSKAPPRTGHLAVGLSAALIVLFRPNALAWVPILVLWMGWRRGLASGGWTLAGALLVLAPVLALGSREHGQAVPVTTSAGANLYLGNVPDPALHASIPYYRELPGPVAGWAWKKLGRRAFESGATTPQAQSQWHAARAWEAMAADPSGTGVRFAKKGLALFDAFPMSNNRDLLREGSPFSCAWLTHLGWGLIWPLTAIGLCAGFLRRRPEAHTALLFALVYGTTLCLFFVSERHRAPLAPVLIALAAAGTAEWIAGWRAFQARTRLVAVGLGVSFLTLAHGDWLGHRTLYADYEIDPVGVGLVHARRGAPREAEAAFGRALERDPRDALALANLGAMRLDREPGDAAELFAKSLEEDPHNAQTTNQLGLAQLALGASGAAARSFERATALDPQWGLAWANRGRAALALGELDQARAHFQRALELDLPAPARQAVEGLLNAPRD